MDNSNKDYYVQKWAKHFSWLLSCFSFNILSNRRWNQHSISQVNRINISHWYHFMFKIDRTIVAFHAMISGCIDEPTLNAKKS